ncbi:uncharacterized protein LOC127708912 [Mytilus californianus]|uniref:uncharacterized protein LOC127708912 n=1 Tax=Mytilus californianus TaxID=6549 RepID=UPI002246610B|nr:uncharacterized protein LOC127708912 [Mytilus californianus]
MAISKLVLEDDGTEVDSMYFETLPDNCLVMILSDGQVWSHLPSSSCSSSQPSSSSSSGQTGDHSNVNHRVMAMVEQIRKAESASSSRAANTNVTTTCGWQHFSYQFMKYIMVKNTKNQANLGPRSISISRSASENEILQILTSIFFPRGKSVKGRIESMDVKLGSYMGMVITDIGATLRSKKPHFYLLTKEKIPEILSSASSDSDDLPDPEMSLPVLTFRQSPTMQTDWTQPSSQGLTLHTDRTQPSSQGLSMHIDRTQPSSQAYVTPQRSGTGMYSIQQTPETQFVTLQPEVPNVTPQRPSSSSASASLATT